MSAFYLTQWISPGRQLGRQLFTLSFSDQLSWVGIMHMTTTLSCQSLVVIQRIQSGESLRTITAYLLSPTACCTMAKSCPAPSPCCSMALTRAACLSWHHLSHPPLSHQALHQCCQVQSMSCLRGGKRLALGWQRALHPNWPLLALEVRSIVSKVFICIRI